MDLIVLIQVVNSSICTGRNRKTEKEGLKAMEFIVYNQMAKEFLPLAKQISMNVTPAVYRNNNQERGGER